MSTARYNDIGELSAQYKAMREAKLQSTTPRHSELASKIKMMSKTSSPIMSMVASNIGMKSKENSPTKEIPALDSIDSERITRTVYGSVEKLD